MTHLRGTVPFALQRSIVEIEQFKIRATSELERVFGIVLIVLVGMAYNFSSLSSVSIGTVSDGCATAISDVAIGYGANGLAARDAFRSP